MPDFWSHIIAGQEMVEKSHKKRLIKVMEENRELFNFGCQGPDFFFYGDFWPWKKDKKGPDTGVKLHKEKTAELIFESIKYLKSIYNDNNSKGERYSEKFLAYMSGFIAHYALDMKTHPFIFEKAGEGDNHKKMEMNLDIDLMQKKWQLDPQSISPLKAFNLGKELPEYIIDYYFFILNKLFSEKIDKKYINKCYEDFKRFHSIFYSPQNTKYKMIKMIDNFISMDLTIYSYSEKNEAHFLSTDDYSKFYDRYNEAVKEGVRLYQVIFNYLNNQISENGLKKEIPDKSFLA